MADVAYVVRTMRKEDIPESLEVWRETNIDVGKNCIYKWLEFDPEGFKIAVTESGCVLGTCCAIIHNDDLVFVGFYAVRKMYRGLGIGHKVWKACMDHIGNRNAVLNALPGKMELYRDKGGFPIIENEWVCLMNETTECVHPERLSENPPEGVSIQPYTNDHLSSILNYDFKIMGYKREFAIEHNCMERDRKTFVALREGVCVGFGTIKTTFQEAGQVGPLYADDATTAEVLLRTLILSFPHARGFAMRTISSNIPANVLVEKVGCPTAQECARMYRKSKINVDISKIYAVFDPSFSPY